MIKFIRHPGIALNVGEWASGKYLTHYSKDYDAIFADVASGRLGERDVLRSLFANDLWFLVVYGMGVEKAHHPFVVEMARVLETGPKTGTLDVWAREHFKDVSEETPILTTDGWKSHGDLEVGDRVFSPSGESVEVIGTKHFTTSRCFKLTFDNHISLVAGSGHLWKVEMPSRTRIGSKRKTRTTRILTTEQLSECITAQKFRIGILLSNAIHGNEKELPIDPYTLGAWLGDGYSATGAICGIDHDIFKAIESRGQTIRYRKQETNRHNDFRIVCVEGLTLKLRALGLLHNKHIPEVYLTASEKQRRELLWGLIDTDGHISKGRNSLVCFTNSNSELAKQFQVLAISLGYKARLTPVRTCHSWQVTFQAYDDGYNYPCLLQRKRDLLKKGIKRNLPSKTWYINSIEPVSTVDTNCITVDSEDGMYLAGRELIPTHNSLLMTQAETLQYHLKNADHCTGIFAYVRPAAKAFLRSIKILCEQSDLLKWCFPEVLWQKPESEAPKWSEDDGLIFKRSNNARKESTIEAWGLIEGMPTGRHFERRIYDDIETDDIRESPDMLAKCFSKFEMSDNLGVDGGVERIIGTFYSHYGPIVKIRDKKDTKGNPMYVTRIRAATDDGTITGKPVLLSYERLEKLKMSQFFNSQQLCDPTPTSEMKLNFSMLKPIEPQFVPKDIYKVMVLDQAGGDETNKQSKDLWSYGIFGIEPCADEIGQSKVYILDIEADQMSHSEGIDGVVRMYMRGGIIQKMGVEKVGLSTTEIHISNAIKALGRRLSIDAGNLELLKPAGRSKVFRIESALQWPLNNSKLFYSTAIPSRYIDSIREEMNKFPFYHVDILDMFAYVYDMMKDLNFIDEWDDETYDKYVVSNNDSRDRLTGY